MQIFVYDNTSAVVVVCCFPVPRACLPFVSLSPSPQRFVYLSEALIAFLCKFLNSDDNFHSPSLPLWPLSFSSFCLLACFVFIYALEEDKQCDDTLTTSRTTTHAQQFRALTYWMVVCLYLSLSLSLSSCLAVSLTDCLLVCLSVYVSASLSTYLSVCVLSLFLCLPLSTKSFFISLLLFSLSPFAN